MNDQRDNLRQLESAVRLAERLESALIGELGGERVRDWCHRHYVAGETLAGIAAEAGVHRSTVYRAVLRMHRRLAAHGLAPAAWSRRVAC